MGKALKQGELLFHAGVWYSKGRLSALSWNITQKKCQKSSGKVFYHLNECFNLGQCKLFEKVRKWFIMYCRPTVESYACRWGCRALALHTKGTRFNVSLFRAGKGPSLKPWSATASQSKQYYLDRWRVSFNISYCSILSGPCAAGICILALCSSIKVRFHCTFPGHCRKWPEVWQPLGGPTSPASWQWRWGQFRGNLGQEGGRERSGGGGFQWQRCMLDHIPNFSACSSPFPFLDLCQLHCWHDKIYR